MPATDTPIHGQELHLPLEPLLAMLRQRGFVIKPDDYLEVLRLVRQFGTADIDATAEWLCPVLATSPFEQSLFYTVVEEYKLRQKVVQVTGTTGGRSLLRRFWWVPPLILLAMIVSLLLPGKPLPLVAKVPPLEEVYQVGDTIHLQASETFEGREKDTSEVFIFWIINNQLPLKGYATSFVIQKPGPLTVVQSLRSEKHEIFRARDSARSFVCSRLVSITVEVDKQEVDMQQTVTLVASSRQPGLEAATFEWTITGPKDTVFRGPATIQWEFDSVGTYYAAARYDDTSLVSNCNLTRETDISVNDDDVVLQASAGGNDWIRPKRKLKSHWHWIFLVPTITGILLFDYLKRRKGKQKKESDKTAYGGLQADYSGLKPVFEVPFEKRDTRLVADEAATRRIFNLLLQKTTDDLLLLNIPETVRTIIKSGGIPDLVYTNRMRQKEYVLLIDRSNPKSMLTAFFEWFARSMQEVNIQATIIYYDSSFTCYYKDYPLGTSLFHCGQLFGNQTLLIFGTGYGLLDAAYPVWNPALSEALNQWDQKALITPIPYPDWSVKEETIGSRLILLPADLEALEYLVPALQEKTLLTESFLRPKKPVWSSLEDWYFEETDQLKEYLRHDTILFQWLCAICLYPKIRWEVIIEAGNAICTRYHTPEKLNYANLLAICRISWIAEGTFPQRTRLNLLKLLDPENEIAVRETLVKMLQTAKNLYGEGYYFSHEQDAQQVTNEFVLYHHDPAKNSHYQDSHTRFMEDWDKDLITDAPLKQYLGQQADKPWTTPLNKDKPGEDAEGKLQKWLRELRIKKRGWMEYAEAILGWVIIFYLLLLFKVFSTDSGVMAGFYQENKDVVRTINVSLQLGDSCLPPGKPVVEFLAGGEVYQMRYLDSSLNPDFSRPQLGIFEVDYSMTLAGDGRVFLSWGNGQTLDADMIHPKDSLLLTFNCSPVADLVKPPDSVTTKRELPTEAQPPPYLQEIWTSRSGRMAIDLAENMAYLKQNNQAAIQKLSLRGFYAMPNNEGLLMAMEGDNGTLVKAGLSGVSATGLGMGLSYKTYPEMEALLRDTIGWEAKEDFGLYYPGDANRLFIPRDGKSYPNDQLKKIREMLTKQAEIIANANAMAKQQQQQVQQPARGVAVIHLKVHLNTFYYDGSKKRQARYAQIRDGLAKWSKEGNFTWEQTSFAGGPFDRDYIEMFHQYKMPQEDPKKSIDEGTPDEPANKIPEQRPATAERIPLSESQLMRIVKIAMGEVGVTEEPPGSNRGKRVNEYLAATGLQPGLPWSAAFIYWVYQQGGQASRLRKSGTVLTIWNSIPAGEKLSPKEAMANPGAIQPGNIFFISYGKNSAHAGIVESVEGDTIYTIEGNSNNKGGDDGTQVVRVARPISSVNLGFSNFGRPSLPASKY